MSTPRGEELNLNRAFGLPLWRKVSLQWDSLFEDGCWGLGQTNSPSSARHGDGPAYIRIWATQPKRLVFWDDAPSPTIFHELVHKIHGYGEVDEGHPNFFHTFKLLPNTGYRIMPPRREANVSFTMSSASITCWSALGAMRLELSPSEFYDCCVDNSSVQKKTKKICAVKGDNLVYKVDSY